MTATLAGEIKSLKDELAKLEGEWAEEQKLVGEIRSLSDILNPPHGGEASKEGTQVSSGPGVPDKDEARKQIRRRLVALAERDPVNRMIYPFVDEQVVASVVSDWTGIPVGRMVKDEIENVLSLPATLGQRVVGQSHGLAMIARRIETSRAKLDNPNKPIGVFMLCGPSGVGKTETALALADTLVRRRAEHDRDQHVRVSGGAYRLVPEGRSARICRLQGGRGA